MISLRTLLLLWFLLGCVVGAALTMAWGASACHTDTECSLMYPGTNGDPD